MRVKIEIDGSTLDLYESVDNDFYITKQINDLRNLQNRQADYTRQIEIPSTPHNKNILNLLTNEPQTYSRIDCNMLIDNITIIPHAKLFIPAYNDENISIVIYAGNFDLYENIQDESIKELDTTSYNFAWSTTGLNGLENETEGAVNLLSSFIDETEILKLTPLSASFTNQIEIKLFGFFFYLKTIFRLIIEEAGYTLDETNVSTDYYYNNLVIACPVNSFLNVDVEEGYYALVDRTGNQTMTCDGSLEVITFNNAVSDTSALFDLGNYRYTIPADGNYVMVFIYDIDYTKNGTENLTLSIYNGTNKLISKSIYSSGTNITGSITLNLTAASGDYIYAYLTGPSGDSATVNDGSSFELSMGSSTTNIIPSNWFSDINKRTFVIEFLTLFNGFINSDPITKIVTVTLFDDIKTGTPQDWSNNIDIAKQQTNNIALENYYTRNELKFNVDQNVKREGTNYIAEINTNESLPIKGTVINSLFSPPDLSVMFLVGVSDVNVVPIYDPSFSEGSAVTYTTASGAFTFAGNENFSPGDYIWTANGLFRIKTKTSKTQGSIYYNWPGNGTSVDNFIVKFRSRESNPIIGLRDFDDGKIASMYYGVNSFENANGTSLTPYFFRFLINWEELYNTYYIDLFNALKTPNIITAFFWFNPLEFVQLDMTRPVVIDGFNGTFYINKIEQYKLNAPCRVELIRINSFQ